MTTRLIKALLTVLLLTSLSLGQPTVDGRDFRGGASIHRLSLIDPLGAGGFAWDVRAQFLQMEVDTSTFDMRFNIAYGALPGFDFALYIPYMRMTSGVDYKYGAGDAVISFKYFRSQSIRNPFKWGIQGSVLLPTGYPKSVPGMPPFSTGKYGFGGRLLLQLTGNKITLTGNSGYFLSESGSFKDMFFGFGIQVNVLKRYLMMVGEITSTQPINEGETYSYAFVGAETTLPYVGIGFKIGLESKVNQDLPLSLVIGASLTSPKTLPGVSEGIIDAKSRYKKVMVFEFLQEEEGFMGDDIEEQFCRILGSLDDVTIVNPPSFKLAEEAVSDRSSAVAIVGEEKADLLIFARYLSFGFQHDRGFSIPYLISFPKTVAEISAEMWVIDTKSQKQIFTGIISGKASKYRGTVMFPTQSALETYQLDAVQKEKIRQQALDNLVRNMAAIFSDKLK